MLPRLDRLVPSTGTNARPVLERLRDQNTIKVLILCHPAPFAGHWQENVIREQTETLFADRLVMGQTIDYFTLDPEQTPTTRADFPVGFMHTLFKETKWSTVERWDMVWAPDCGGEWWAMWNLKGQAQRDEFLRLVQIMSKSLLPGGFLMLGKLPFQKIYDSDTDLQQAIGLLSEVAEFAHVEHVPVPDPYSPEASPALTYIRVQKCNASRCKA